MEQTIRGQKAGMVGIQKEDGMSYYGDVVDGKVIVKSEKMNNIAKEIILKVDGDTIYTLEETFENGEAIPRTRQVTKDSLNRMVRELSEPLPEGSSVSVSNNIMTVKMSFNYSFDYVISGHQVVQATTINGTFTLNLENPKCTGQSSSVGVNTVTVDGVLTKLPNSTSKNSETCGADLSSTELKALDLSSIKLCDESVEVGEDEPTPCEDPADLSYLVE